MPPDSASFHLQQQPSTLHLAVPNNFAFVMSKQCWCPIRDYFNRNGLELSDEKRALLVDWGCDSVESLKLLESNDWDTIFDSSYKKVKLRIGSISWKRRRSIWANVKALLILHRQKAGRPHPRTLLLQNYRRRINTLKTIQCQNVWRVLASPTRRRRKEV